MKCVSLKPLVHCMVYSKRLNTWIKIDGKSYKVKDKICSSMKKYNIVLFVATLSQIGSPFCILMGR